MIGCCIAIVLEASRVKKNIPSCPGAKHKLYHQLYKAGERATVVGRLKIGGGEANDDDDATPEFKRERRKKETEKESGQSVSPNDPLLFSRFLSPVIFVDELSLIFSPNSFQRDDN